MRWDTIKAYVLVDGQALPMTPVPLVKNRWEGFVPVPPSANTASYRFKFDYLYNVIGAPPKPNSIYSPVYKLTIDDQ